MDGASGEEVWCEDNRLLPRLILRMLLATILRTWDL